MYQRPFLVFVLAALAGCTGGSPQSDPRPATPKPLSQLRLDPALFGDGWSVSPGVVLDHWDELQQLPDEVKEVFEVVRTNAEPLGVIAFGDYSGVRTKGPLNGVTVRVFLFEDAARCQAWRDKKYRYEGWEKHYKPVDGASHFAVDSTQLKKRIVVIGRYWITSHHIGEGDIHIRALESIVSQLGLVR